MKRKFLAFIFVIFGFQHAALASETAISKLQKAINSNGLAIVFFGFFCAWWAKTTGRSALGWFILGLLFHVFTAIALLIKTERST
jgi:hypothetical protein